MWSVSTNYSVIFPSINLTSFDSLCENGIINDHNRCEKILIKSKWKIISEST